MYGIGETKLAQFGEAVWAMLDEHCRLHGLSRDVDVAALTYDATLAAADGARPSARHSRSPEVLRAFDLFRQGKSLDDVVLATGRAYSTVSNYLAEFIREKQPASISAWVSDDIYRQVAAAAERVGRERLKPIFVALEERVAYSAIRLVLAHLASTLGDA